MSPSTFEQDLQTRWQPSAEQVEQATALLKAEPEADVYTTHLLLNKEHGWWDFKVVVEPLPGVYTSREGALEALKVAVEEKAKTTSEPISGGYTWHWLREGEPVWAVWEDILARANQEF